MNLPKIEIVPLLDTLQILDITDEEYFGPNYRGYISNSSLALINPEQDGSPKDFFEGLSKHSKYSDSLYFGSAVHEMVLQPESFQIIETVNRPTAKAGFMADELYKKSGKVPTDEEIIAASDKISYYKGKMDKNKIEELKTKCINYWRNRAIFESTYQDSKVPIYLDEKSREKLKICLDSINNNKKIQKLLHPDYLIQEPISLNEQAILLDVQINMDGVEPFILKLKAKLDNFTISPEDDIITLNDLKTTGHFTTEFANSWEKYHYYRQMGMYGWLLTLVAQKFYNIQNPILRGNMLLISTVPQYYSDVFEVTKKEFQRGFKEFKYLLRLVAYYKVNGYE